MSDEIVDILTGLAGERILEYHSTSGSGGDRRHHITTCSGYEISLSDEEVAPFALGATAAEFNRTTRYIPLASAVLDEMIERRWGG